MFVSTENLNQIRLKCPLAVIALTECLIKLYVNYVKINDSGPNSCVDSDDMQLAW